MYATIIHATTEHIGSGHKAVIAYGCIRGSIVLDEYPTARPRFTIVIACGLLNIYDGHPSIEELFGEDRVEPFLSYERKNLMWLYDEEGRLIDGYGNLLNGGDIDIFPPASQYNIWLDELVPYQNVLDGLFGLYEYTHMMQLYGPTPFGAGPYKY